MNGEDCPAVPARMARHVKFFHPYRLRPRVTFGGDTAPDSHAVMEMHRKARENGFIGNSLPSTVVLEPRF